MPSSSPSRSAVVALLAGVFVTGCLGEFAGEALKAVARPSGLGIVRGQLLANIFSTILLTLGTAIIVFALCRRTPIRSLPVSRIGLVALFAGVAGRYVGLALGRVVRGGRLPSPTELVSPADLALRLSNPGLVLIILVGFVTAGLWSLVSAFGGIGLVTLISGTDNSPTK